MIFPRLKGGGGEREVIWNKISLLVVGSEVQQNKRECFGFIDHVRSAFSILWLQSITWVSYFMYHSHSRQHPLTSHLPGTPIHTHFQEKLWKLQGEAGWVWVRMDMSRCVCGINTIAISSHPHPPTYPLQNRLVLDDYRDFQKNCRSHRD